MSTTGHHHQPLVSVGVPVYNGAETLRRALDSVLAQDYPHLELIISDNGSTDGTRAICEAVAAQDPRVIYVRHDTNSGPVWNFNHVVGLARGTYFMRMSHDDVREPTYLSKCVALLEANPRAVLSHSYTAAFYGDISNVMCVLTHDDVVGVPNARRRFMRALRHLPASAIDGVFRTDPLRQKTRLMEDYLSSDIVLTHELSLHGEFVQVPEVLFWRSGKAILPAPQTVHRWAGHAQPMSRLRAPVIVLLLNHLRSIRRSRLSAIGKALLSLQVIAHECGTAVLRVALRSTTAALGDRSPVWFLRLMIAMAGRNPNVRILKDPRELPPVLRPTWRLLNHRNMEQALALQQKLDAKLYPARA